MDAPQVRPLGPAKDEADYQQAVDEVTRRLQEIHDEQSQTSILHWVIYGPTTPQHPGFYAARLWFIRPKHVPTNVVARAKSLEQIRELLPKGLVCIPRFDQDHPDIVEVWTA